MLSNLETEMTNLTITIRNASVPAAKKHIINLLASIYQDETLLQMHEEVASEVIERGEYLVDYLDPFDASIRFTFK